MKKNIIYLLSSLLFLPTLVACSDFLDQDPDMRATVDTEEKVAKLLTTGYIYQAGSYMLTAELSSDNVCDNGDTSNYTQLVKDEYEWNDDATTGNDSPYRVWGANFECIATANQALEYIKDLGGNDPTKMSSLLKNCYGEALLIRAYSYFILANMFCMPYYGDGSEEEYLGLPYLETPETDLYPLYERGTLKDLYDHIQADLEEGIPYLDDSQYSVPKYHFNQKAANTFASRFYVFTKQWDKAIEYATNALGDNPSSYLRDHSEISAVGTSANSRAQIYTDNDVKANFFIQAAISSNAQYMMNYSGMNRYTHYKVVGDNETVNTTNPFNGGQASATAIASYGSYSSSQKYCLFHCWYTFQYTDLVASTGYSRTVSVPLNVEEALLNRAEAYIMQDNYSAGLADINLYASAVYSNAQDVTLDIANFWATQTYEEYSIPFVGRKSSSQAQTLNPKKHLRAYPYNTIAEGSDKENLLHVLLYARRYAFLHVGMRWFDTRRFGITVYRFALLDDLETISDVTDAIADEGETDSYATQYSSGHIDSYGHNLRRALQVPLDIRTAGLEANPR